MKSIWFAIASMSLAVSTASATVRREGTWPEHEPKIDLDLRQAPRHEAIRQVADAAGWNLIVDIPIAGTTPIDVKLKDEEAGKVLDVLLRDGNYVAHRDGKIVTIKADASNPLASSTPSASASPRLDDVNVMGGADRIDRGAFVRDVKVVGGSLEVFGTINGGLNVYGGSVHLRAGSHVKGDIRIVGGSVRADEGAVVDHQPKVIGGSYSKPGHVEIRADKGGINIHDSAASEAPKTRLAHFGDRVMHIISGASILFLFGIVVLTLASNRAEMMRLEVASRPMRSLATGIVCLLAIPFVLVLLCVTVIGIPFAVAGVLLLTLGGFAALVCALQVLGELLVRHKTTNPYAHLALGIALYAVAAALPIIGEWVVLGAILVSVGVFISTRAAGFVKKKGAAPYRSVAEL